MLNPPPPTWEDQRGLLPPLGSKATELIRRLTAPARHDWRTREALRAAVAFGDELVTGVNGNLWLEQVNGYRPPPGISFEVHAIGAYLALALENMGSGGPYGLGGSLGATARLPHFDQLGKGRRQATDGGAWSAAIAAALSRDWFGEVPMKLSLRVSDSGLMLFWPRKEFIVNETALPAEARECLGRNAVAALANALGCGMCSGEERGSPGITLHAPVHDLIVPPREYREDENGQLFETNQEARRETVTLHLADWAAWLEEQR